MAADASSFTPPSPEPGTPGHPLALALSDIKIAHSVFALPFAILGAVLASPVSAPGAGASDWRRFAGQAGIVVLCMVLARTWAMLVNRIADRRFDAANPRTANRAVASGRLPAGHALMIALVCAGAFVGAAALFWPLFGNPWPALLALPTLAWIAFYSFTKRFTPLAHLFLGGALAASPLAAAIAVRPESLGDTPSLFLLATMVLCWVAGFDVLYALQDIDFDRSAGLRSIPAALGARRAAIVSRVLHVAAIGALLGAWRIDPRFGWLFLAAACASAALLVWEHVHIARAGLRGLPLAFGVLNGCVAIVLGLAGTLDAVAL